MQKLDNSKLDLTSFDLLFSIRTDISKEETDRDPLSLDQKQKDKIYDLATAAIKASLPLIDYSGLALDERNFIPPGDSTTQTTPLVESEKENVEITKEKLFSSEFNNLVRAFNKDYKNMNKVQIGKKINEILDAANETIPGIAPNYLFSKHLEIADSAGYSSLKTLNYSLAIQTGIENGLPISTAVFLNALDLTEEYDFYFVDYIFKNELSKKDLENEIDIWNNFTSFKQSTIVKNSDLTLWPKIKNEELEKKEVPAPALNNSSNEILDEEPKKPTIMRDIYSSHRDVILSKIHEDQEVDSEYLSQELSIPLNDIENVLKLLVEKGFIKSEPYSDGSVFYRVSTLEEREDMSTGDKYEELVQA